MIDIEQAWDRLRTGVYIHRRFMDLARERFARGYETYGDSGLVPGDSRDPAQEGIQEAIDCINYAAMKLGRLGNGGSVALAQAITRKAVEIALLFEKFPKEELELPGEQKEMDDD